MNSADTARTIATLALAFAGPLTVVTGVAVVVMIPRGVPSFVVWLFAVSIGATALAILSFLALAAQDGTTMADQDDT